MNTKAPTDLRRGDRVLCTTWPTRGSRYLTVAGIQYATTAPPVDGPKRSDVLLVTFTDGSDVMMGTELMVVVE